MHATLLALAAMLAVLTTASVTVFTVTVLAPEVAPAVGFDPAAIGVYVSIAYLVAMFSGAVTGAFVIRYGPIRVCQFSLGCAMLGMLALGTGAVPLVVLSAVLLGLAYGPYNPASAVVLGGVATPRWQPFIFSVKQTGVPLGGMLAGALAPGLALWLGDWRGAVLVIAMLAATVMLGLQPLRRRFDAERDPRRPLGRLGIAGPLRVALGDPVLRRYTIAAFAYAGCQVAGATYLVVHFTESLGMSLLGAGALFAFVQGGGVAGRLVWGAAAGSRVAPRHMLVFLGVTMSACLVGTVAMSAEWPFLAMAVLAIALGMSSFGWNGVMLSEIVTHAPPGGAAVATGGMQFVMFGGVTVFPLVFGAISALADSYAAGFLGLAGLGLWGAGLLATMPGTPAGRGRPGA